MAFIIPATANKKGRIGYKNLFTTSGVTVTTSSDQSGFEKENAYDWKPYDWWKPSAAGANWLRASFGAAKAADYMAISAHNLGTLGATIKCQYSTNGGSSWTDIGGTIAPIGDSVIFVTFYWRNDRARERYGSWICPAYPCAGSQILYVGQRGWRVFG